MIILYIYHSKMCKKLISQNSLCCCDCKSLKGEIQIAKRLGLEQHESLTTDMKILSHVRHVVPAV